MTFKKILQRHPLKGTPKQKEWAQIIRSKKLAQLETIGFTGVLKIIRPHLTNERLEAMGCTTEKNFKILGWWIAEHALMEEEASWWIKTRDENPKEWIDEACSRCIREWEKTKPFKDL
jgi:hypothetical protein